jgi:hypothetical protein
MKTMLTIVIMCSIGAVLASSGLSVTKHWQAWAIIVLAALHGLVGSMKA